MSNGNPYYGGGGGGGGGFVPGGSPFGSQESPGGGRKSRANQTLRPVTIKQIIDAAQAHPDSDFQIDGVDVQAVQFVGSVHNQSATATNVSYEIGDGTGYIDVRQWLDSADDEAGKTSGIEQDKYVVITGNIKVFGGKRHVSAQHIRPVTNHDEVYHHLLKAVYVSQSFRNPNGASGGAGAGAGAGANHSDYAAAAPAAISANDYAHLPPLQRKVMEVVSAEEHDDGIHVSLVSRRCGTANGEEVMEAIESLMSEGMLFSTIDDLHIKAA
ncbi:Replication factor A protein 2 [Vanrija pseudolonga]|uniref:Replication factor A protein 2 n=1 Tax=Vanrija pseudolonga TaxID=143232 RepID=A0AAF0XZA8_9TREE|nr:Replication factor A protein 2 [Vanrija pseudolonga]